MVEIKSLKLLSLNASFIPFTGLFVVPLFEIIDKEELQYNDWENMFNRRLFRATRFRA